GVLRPLLPWRPDRRPPPPRAGVAHGRVIGGRPALPERSGLRSVPGLRAWPHHPPAVGQEHVDDRAARTGRDGHLRVQGGGGTWRRGLLRLWLGGLRQRLLARVGDRGRGTPPGGAGVARRRGGGRG